VFVVRAHRRAILASSSAGRCCGTGLLRSSAPDGGDRPGLRENGLSYLLFLRLSPRSRSFLSTLRAGSRGFLFERMPWARCSGFMPGSLVFVIAGRASRHRNRTPGRIPRVLDRSRCWVFCLAAHDHQRREEAQGGESIRTRDQGTHWPHGKRRERPESPECSSVSVVGSLHGGFVCIVCESLERRIGRVANVRTSATRHT